MKNYWMTMMVLICSIISCKTQKDLNNKVNEDYKQQWESIENNIKKGFPEKAITGLDELVIEARKNNDEGVVTRAVLRKINLKNLDQEDFMEAQLPNIQSILTETSDPVCTSFLNYAQAIIYYNYWQSNQAKIPAKSFGDDEWDGEQYAERIDELFSKSQSEKNKGLLVKDLQEYFTEMPYDPEIALWDFFQWERIRLSKSSVYIKLFGEEEGRNHVASLYDELIEKLHQYKQEKLALEATISKLTFLGEKLSDYKGKVPAEYKYIVDYHQGLVYYHEGQQLDADRAQQSQKYLLALEKFKRTQESGDSIYQNNARVKIASIRKPELQVLLEDVVLPEQASLALIRSKNLEKVYLKIYKLSKEDYLANRREKGLPYKGKPIVHESEIAIPKAHYNLTSQTTEVAIPELVPGFYGVMVNTARAFKVDSKQPLFQSNFLVSKLAINYYYDHSTLKMNLECVDRKSGDIISGANFKIFDRKYDRRSEGQKQITIYEGKSNPVFSYTPSQNQNYYPYVEADGHYFIINDGLYQNYRYAKDEFTANILTDRSIYRPGDIVHFQGILYHRDAKRRPSIQADLVFEVNISDNFGNKVETMILKSDDFGAFDGKFSIPEGAQNGYLNFRLSSKAIKLSAHKSIRVEEYKRPKYQVTFEDFSQELRLDEEVKVKAKAISYTGIPLADAKVSYKVYRSAWWPYFYRGYRSYFPPGSGDRVLLESGFLISTNEGGIDFVFNAERSLRTPDLKSFNYEVEIEVVDNSGETKVATRTFTISEQGVFIKFEETEQGGTYRITAVNADNQNVSANVAIEVFQAKDKSYYIDRYWEMPDTSQVQKANFPQFSFTKESEKYTESVYKASLELEDSVVVDFKDIVGAGSFKILLRAGDDPELIQHFEIVDFEKGVFGNQELFYTEEVAEKYAPSEFVNFRIGSNLKGLKVHVQKYRDVQLIEENWVSLNDNYLVSEQIGSEDYGGYTYVMKSYYNNRVYEKTVHVNVPWSHKDLFIKPKSIRYITEPGAIEKWTFVVVDQDGLPIKSKLLSSMYDASLDEFQAHDWAWDIYPLYLGAPYSRNHGFSSKSLYSSNYSWNQIGLKMRQFEILPQFAYSPINFMNYGHLSSRRGGIMRKSMAMDAVPVEGAVMEADAEAAAPLNERPEGVESKKEDLSPSPINVRTNLDELVFFYPGLESNEDGEVTLSFESSEALSKWKLQNFAFTKDLKYGFSSEEIVTKKELMIQANQPRFLRSGDKIYLSAKLINLSDEEQTVKASLSIYDIVAKENINIDSEKAGISLEVGEQKDIVWEVDVPKDVNIVRLIYSVIGDKHDDAEQHVVPVLPSEVFLIESETVLLDAQGSGKVDVQQMLSGNKRTSALTIESTGSPAWYAVRSLPYLMENEHENSEAIFNRYFANALALKILDENPQVEAYYKKWQDGGDLNSQLSLNSELKKVDISATPWIKVALSEEESMARMADLFDRLGVEKELASTLQKLKAMQDPSGGFPWYQGGRLNHHMSQYILLGMLQMEELGLSALNPSLKEDLYRFCLQEALKRDWKRTDRVPSILIKSVWISEVMPKEIMPAYTKLAKEIKQSIADKWFEYGLEDQVYIAKIFKKENRRLTDEIAASLMEKSFIKEQLGRFWNNENQGFYRSSDISVHTAMISLFNELGGYGEAIDEMKFWLITNKRTNNWRSNIATSSAIYALSLGSASSFTEGQAIRTSIDESLMPSNAVAGINYDKISFNDFGEVKQMKEIVFENPNDNKAWANVHHQFFQNYIDVARTESDFLDIKKEMYRVGSGDELENIDGKRINLGDRIRVRLIIDVDRPMQFIHISDERPGGAEPIDNRSGYQWGSSLSYYLSVKDSGTHFFVDYLMKGKHVVEYDMFINNRGAFNAGVAEIQNMYAPEFNDYSKAIRIRVE